jgi:hypothetical protein
MSILVFWLKTRVFDRMRLPQGHPVLKDGGVAGKAIFGLTQSGSMGLLNRLD